MSKRKPTRKAHRPTPAAATSFTTRANIRVVLTTMTIRSTATTGLLILVPVCSSSPPAGATIITAAVATIAVATGIISSVAGRSFRYEPDRHCRTDLLDRSCPAPD